MEPIIIYAIIGIILALVAGFFLGISYQKKRCMDCCTYDLNLELNGAVRNVSWLVDRIGVVKKLQFDEAAKKELMEFIHDRFFFNDYKDPKRMYERLERRRDELLSMSCYEEENKVVAGVYQEIIDGISDSWLEKRP